MRVVQPNASYDATTDLQTYASGTITLTAVNPQTARTGNTPIQQAVGTLIRRMTASTTVNLGFATATFAVGSGLSYLLVSGATVNGGSVSISGPGGFAFNGTLNAPPPPSPPPPPPPPPPPSKASHASSLKSREAADANAWWVDIPPGIEMSGELRDVSLSLLVDQTTIDEAAAAGSAKQHGKRGRR
ncbi:MAG: hypothetical protein JO013_05250 [Alphaproteobacteria bacterium]|nr:hypothetical protein [Alphaproteobacteria bacterium]